jgi:hypothetical protein
MPPIIVDPAVITQIKNDISAIEQELGVDPNGVYSTVRTRLDILEARINNPLAPAPNVENPFYIGNDGVSISTGDGYPTENRVDGSLYLRKDGYVEEGLYARRGGVWSLVETAPWIGNGDLFGDSSSQTVIGLQGNPLSANAPNVNDVVSWDGTQWLPQPGFSAGGDLTGTATSQTVVALQGNDVANTAPTNAQVLTWVTSNNNWEPASPAVIYDTLAGLSNIKRSSGSIINNTKQGITNLSYDGSVTDDYSAILGGRANQVANQFSSVVGGFDNAILNASDYSFIGGGESNTINGAEHCGILGGESNSVGDGLGGASYSSILGGIDNSITTGNYSVILGGDSNTVSNDFSAILSGDTNQVSSSYSAILSGDNNTITGVASIIGSGSNNTISGIKSSVISGVGNNLTSDYCTVIGGDNNSLESQYVTIKGSDNDVAVLTSPYATIFGSSNTVQVFSSYVTIFGDSNDIGSTKNEIFGDNNTLAANSDGSFVKGDNNSIGSSLSSIVFGDSNTIGNNNDGSFVLGNSHTLSGVGTVNLVTGYANIVSGGGYSSIFGADNTSTAYYSFVTGTKGNSVYDGQFVHAIDAFSGAAGHSQYSRVMLSGSNTAGAAFDLTIPGTVNNLALENSKSYDICVRIIVVNTTGVPTCARYIYDILAHQEAGTITLDNVNGTLVTDNGTGWTVSIVASVDELVITVDNSGVDDRRAIATVEWRELLRS